MDATATFSPEIPHGTRLEELWEILKPTIEYWYLDQKFSVAKLAKHMKENHGFDAFEHQYKFQFRKWGLKKNFRAKEKANIERMVMTRADLGRSTVVEYKGRKLDSEKIRRHAKNAKRREMVLRDPDVGFGGSIVAKGSLAFGKSM
ncbi:hypothetical protein GTA08_BOTSDO05066 [Neofusicoccum parvum]|uniref:Uncharacterized protein n=1 Tax=Neofusicoccum parvum TaxID=310453 RepID=A0ACB5RWI1_9PEZI|nr:hypothetical protein GTA08_BOTSDO05066 [Neofusicoccum parvum]